MEERVGIVGLGFMGQAFTANLLRAGFCLQGFDIDARRMKEFEGQGGIPVSSAAKATEGARWVLTSLPNSTIARDVVLGPGGIVEGGKEGLIITDTTTSRPEDSISLGAELGRRGIRFLDAGVSGTSTMAWKKNLVVIAGGEAADFQACSPLFAGFSKAAYHMGPLGSGALAKLIINLVLACNRFGLAEGLVLGMKSGMNLENLMAALKGGAAGSKAMDQKGEMMIKGDYTAPSSRLTTTLKDVRLMLEQSQRYGAPMFVMGIFSQIVQAGVQMGYGEFDPVAFIEVLREMAGLVPRPGEAFLPASRGFG